jgi:hypothetical protein
MLSPSAREALVCSLAATLLYASLAVLLHHTTPRLFRHLDQLFEADMGIWTIEIARPQGPHGTTVVHPLALLVLNPLGASLRGLLRWAGVPFAARLAAALLAAVAGGAAVGLFRVLLGRLAIAAARARGWTAVFALCATQIVFSSIPESFSFSALSLILVFVVAASAEPSEAKRLAAGVFSFGITFTNLVAVWLARASAFDWRREGRRALAQTLRHLALVLVLAAGLSLVQKALYPSARLFFVPALGDAYERAFVALETPRDVAVRAAKLGAHLAFVPLAAPYVVTRQTEWGSLVVDFSPHPLSRPRLSSALHAAAWLAALVIAARGLLRERGRLPRAAAALALWLGFQAVLHFFFGLTLFLYSGAWTFALVALVAVGHEAAASRSPRRGRLVASLLVSLVVLQSAANASLVLDVVRLFSEPG